MNGRWKRFLTLMFVCLAMVLLGYGPLASAQSGFVSGLRLAQAEPPRSCQWSGDCLGVQVCVSGRCTEAAASPDQKSIALPVDIDLSAEHAYYESKKTERTWGYVCLGILLAGGAAAGFGYVSAFQTQSTLQAETLPINTTTRQQLISQGQTYNIIGLVGAVVGAVGLAVGVVLLPLSF